MKILQSKIRKFPTRDNLKDSKILNILKIIWTNSASTLPTYKSLQIFVNATHLLHLWFVNREEDYLSSQTYFVSNGACQCSIFLSLLSFSFFLKPNAIFPMLMQFNIFLCPSQSTYLNICFTSFLKFILKLIEIRIYFYVSISIFSLQFRA